MQKKTFLYNDKISCFCKEEPSMFKLIVSFLYELFPPVDIQSLSHDNPPACLTFAASTMLAVASASCLAAASNRFCISESEWLSASPLIAPTKEEVAWKAKFKVQSLQVVFIDRVKHYQKAHIQIIQYMYLKYQDLSWYISDV